MDVKVKDRVKVYANGSWTIPRVIEITDDNLVVQRRLKGREVGRLIIPRHKFERMPKFFRGALYECTIKAKI